MKISLSLILLGTTLASTSVHAQQATEAKSDAATLGLNHVGFAVSNLDASVSFFVDTLGWKPAGGQLDYPAKFVMNDEMFVTLWQVIDTVDFVAFDRKNNVGLHHMAITVRDLEALEELHRKFVARDDVTVEFAPEFLGEGPTTHMMIREPSGLRLEFIVPASRIKSKD